MTPTSSAASSGAPALSAAATTPAAGSPRPVAEGLFQGFGDAARLLGSRCRGCGSLYFPRSLGCRNPACSDRRVEDIALPGAGILYSYTVQAYRPPGLFRMDDWAPYVLALVDLPGDAGGLRVMGMMTACHVEGLRIGMPVSLTTEALYQDEAGCEVHTYKFRPAAAEGAAA